jgi:SAM-dependent methyltransferase
MNSSQWDERYRSSDELWSGDPNPQLVRIASTLSPGKALDAGAGEGADAIWLAQRGWNVDAVDFSAVALERAAKQAQRLGVDDRIRWLQQDLAQQAPEPERYDLASAQFLHMLKDARNATYRNLARAVAPGGTLLIVAHDRSDLQSGVRRPPDPALYFSPQDIEALLEPGRWRIVESNVRERSGLDSEGRSAIVHDVVFCAARSDR